MAQPAELEKALKALAQLEPEPLLSEVVLGGQEVFAPLRAPLKGASSLAALLLTVDLTLAPSQTVHQTSQAASTLLSSVETIKRFDGGSSQVPSAVNAIQASYHKFLSAGHPLFALRAAEEPKLFKASDYLQEVEAARTTATEAETAASSMLSEMRQLMAEGATKAYAENFSSEAEKSYNESKNWLWATGGATLVTLVFAVFVMLSPGVIDINSAAEGIQVALGKLLLFSVLYFLIIWCGKNFRSTRHNSVVNTHRKNALNTFEAFVEAAGDSPDAKGAVLIQATQAIFAPQTSGFLTAETETLGSSSQILEVFRPLGSDKS